MHIHKKENAKRDSLSNHAFRGIMQSQVSHINQPNMLTISKSNTYPNTLESMIYYNPQYQGIISQK